MLVVGLTLAMSGFALLMTGNTGAGVALIVPGLLFFIIGATATRKATPPGESTESK